MRESLTVLAGLLVLTLLAALIGPGFVDWRMYRPQIEQRLSTVLGVETRVAGGIGLTLLPSPRVMLSDVRIGGASGDASTATVERFTAELALSALARGEFRFSDAAVEGATVSLVADEAGAVRLPVRIGPGLPIETSLDRLSLRRSALIWREAGREPVTIAPVAAEISAVSLAGPWRIEGEVAGASLRISTGAMEADGRLRTKGSVTGEDTQVGFDGAIVLPVTVGGVAPTLEGAFTLSPGGALVLSGRVHGGSRQLDLVGLVVDIAGGAARLEGEGQFLPGSGAGSLSLRARRLDADGLVAALGERSGFERGLRGLPGIFDIGLDLDQMIWRGEDFSAIALRGKLNEEGLSDSSASLRVAGALVGATGSAGPGGLAGKVTLKADDARRVALALLRAGLDPALADFIGGLGGIEAEAAGGWTPERLNLTRISVNAASGIRIEGAGDLSSRALTAKLTMNGLDLGSLPVADHFAGLIGSRDLALDLALNRARFRNAPPGSVNLDLRRDGASWRLSRLAVDGFGGVSVNGAGALLPEGGEISGRVRAPRFDALAALAGPILPEGARQALGRAGEGLSRLDGTFRLTRVPSGETGVTMNGAAQAGRLSLDGRLDAAGAWRNASLRFDLADRRQAFAVLGLPTPMLGGPGSIVISHAPGRLAGSLAGPGLSIVLDGDATPLPRLTVQAEGPGQVLPEGAARLLPDGVIDANAGIRFEPEAISLDGLVVNLGLDSARGSLTLPREGAVSGTLSLQRIDLRALLGSALGSAPPPAGAIWSSSRFGSFAGLGELKLRLSTPTLLAWDGIVLRDAGFMLESDADGLTVSDLSGGYGGGQLAGRLQMRRDGGLAQLSGKASLTRIDLAGLTGGAMSGRLSGQIEAGGSGESPARLVSGLGGAGTLSLAGARLARFDPAAYGRIIAAIGEDASESEAARLQQRLTEALDSNAWPLGDVSLSFTLAGGLARLQPLTLERSDLRVDTSGIVDLRSLSADIKLGLRPLGPLPKGWPGDAPQIGVAWRGPLSGLKRETDVGALSNTVAARALAREIERVEAFEADARERAANSRRLRAERETRENERKLAEFLKAEEERRLAEEKRIEEARRAEEARRIGDEKRMEEQRRLDEVRRLAEERRAEELRRAEIARQEQEARRRAEAEARAAAAARAAAQPPQPGPLVLPGAPIQNFPGPALSVPGGAMPLPPPLDIQSVPRPLSRSVAPN
ncbi:AsmA family protein [Bosea sp. PAMC 26642]|uniref:AsmA family protein n=1 Tax=Bosea sp. (strain PAMC 26642) TaxID=1792307 RepID=UPI00077062C0|nr:AsmA family protein [Bosea sp. PAMC 26642]AMJ60613.1 hypothetical protein AXW83_10195 [Bosea sp. PAMC 26642]